MSEIQGKKQIIRGNAIDEGQNKRGWFVGAFIESSNGLQTNSNVEVKWGEHPANEERSSKAGIGDATTLSLLIRGKFGIKLEGEEEILLPKEGDYAMWNPNIAHITNSYEDSLIITVRWPSLSASKN